MPYRVCKSFEVESGHMLSKHPGLCRFPHGHTRRIDVVLEADALDSNDMICDFKAIRLAVGDFLKRFDHSMAMNSRDPSLPLLGGERGRVVVFEGTDPTTEVLAKHIFDFIQGELASARAYQDDGGNTYRFPAGVRVCRVRVSETSSTWAEYVSDARVE